ncbi:MAG: hypothetical protein WA840_17480, partial [Caulobacteraceae bacterium]
AYGHHRPDGDASADPDRPEPGGRAMLFISPCGEPFRARGGEPYPVVAWFHQADTNHDGQLDRAEFIADAVRFFRVLDRNRDDQIDGDELRAYEHVVVPEIAVGAGRGVSLTLPGAGPVRLWPVAELELIQGGIGGLGGGGGGGGRHHGNSGGSSSSQTTPGVDDGLVGAAPYNLLSEPEPVAASDLSFTGRISLADFKTRAGQRFDLLDPDGRGYLTLDTLPHTKAQDLVRRPPHRRPPPPSQPQA